MVKGFLHTKKRILTKLPSTSSTLLFHQVPSHSVLMICPTFRSTIGLLGYAVMYSSMKSRHDASSMSSQVRFTGRKQEQAQMKAAFSQLILQLGNRKNLLGFTDDEREGEHGEIGTYMVCKLGGGQVVSHMKHSHHQRRSKT